MPTRLEGPTSSGHLAGKLMHFGRLLRAAGLPVPTDRIALALNALQVAGLGSRADFHDALMACLLDRHEHREVFDRAFDLFWHLPDLCAPAATQAPHATAAPASHRVAEALLSSATVQPEPGVPAPDAFETTPSWSAGEALRRADFDTMTAEEWRAAQRLLRTIALLFEPLATRRQAPAPGPGHQARVDGRATLRALARHGGEAWQLRWRRPRARPAPLVVLADISGSMSRYSRMLLHFTHALGHAEARVESFVFGTRLTRTTHALRQRDPDLAIARVVHEVQDWSGGTRISACLHDFNRHWARRTLGTGATVLLISDGLEHGTPEDPRCERLAREMERLHKSCRRLLWLNPLLRFAQFQPRAAGIRAMRPHVDAFLPTHNLQSLQDLAAVLAAPALTTGR